MDLKVHKLFRHKICFTYAIFVLTCNRSLTVQLCISLKQFLRSMSLGYWLLYLINYSNILANRLLENVSASLSNDHFPKKKTHLHGINSC
jgi:hypothetical protein